MPSKLPNPAKRRVPKNYSLELRVQDLILEDSLRLETTESDVANQILKRHYGIMN